MADKLPHVSINQLAEFSAASSSLKMRIVTQQLEPDKFRLPYFQSAKAGMRRYLADVSDLTPLYEQIEKQKARKVSKPWQKSCQQISLAAITRLVSMNLKRYLKVPYEVIPIKRHPVMVEGVAINVSPEVIIKAEIDGKIVYGGVKIHLSKTKPFTFTQCCFVAEVLRQYIGEVAEPGAIVLPEFCLCIDILGDRIVTAADSTLDEDQIETACREFADLWAKAA